MSELDAVAEAICNARCGDLDAWNITYGSGRDLCRREAQAAIDVLRPTISTVDELDALPDGTVIHPLGSKTVASIEKRHRVWWPSRGTGPIPVSHIQNAIPALVVWLPDESGAEWPSPVDPHVSHAVDVLTEAGVDRSRFEQLAQDVEAATTVRTVDELDALPVGTVVRDNTGVVAQSVARPGGQAPAWVWIGRWGRATGDEIPLPARVLELGAVNR